jgi:hypothetical protein
MLSRRLVLSALGAGIAMLAGTAFAADQPRPVAGKWKLRDSDHTLRTASLHISGNRRYVTSLRLVPKADDAGDACSQPATITGRFKLRAAPNFAGDRVWYIGKSDHNGQTTPYKITAHVGSESYRGYLRGAFSNKTHGFGDMQYGPCAVMTFKIRKS